MRTFSLILTIAIIKFIFLQSGSTLAQKVELNNVDRSTDKFSYHELGAHVPTKSGYAGYTSARDVVHQNINLPIKIDPSNRKFMYCNTQVWGYKSDGTPGGKSNHKKNFQFPNTPTMCEIRWVKGKQLTRVCGRDAAGNLRTTHQGTDCRPPSGVGGTHPVRAVEKGRVTRVRDRGSNGNGYVYVSGRDVEWKYRHVGNIRVERNQIVEKGEQIATVSDIGSTPVHLHLECLVKEQYRDCFPALMAAYMRRLNLPHQIEKNKLKYNPCYEIKKGSARPERTDGCELPSGGQSEETENSQTVTSGTCVNPNVVAIENRKQKSELTRNFLALTVYRPKPDRPFNRIPEIENFPGWKEPESAVLDRRNGWIYEFKFDESGVGVSYYWLANRARYTTDKFRPTPRELAHSMAGVRPEFCRGDDFKPTTAGKVEFGSNAGTWCTRVETYINGWLGTQSRPGLARHYMPIIPTLNTKLDLTSYDGLWNWLRVMYRHESGREMVIDRETFVRGVKLARDYISEGNPSDFNISKYLYSCGDLNDTMKEPQTPKLDESDANNELSKVYEDRIKDLELRLRQEKSAHNLHHKKRKSSRKKSNKRVSQKRSRPLY